MPLWQSIFPAMIESGYLQLSQKPKFVEDVQNVKVKQNIKQEIEVPAEIIQIYDSDEDEDMVPDTTSSSTSTLAVVPSKKRFKTTSTSLNKSSTQSNKCVKINKNHVGSRGNGGDGGSGSKEKK